MNSINHDTTINYCELDAIDLILTSYYNYINVYGNINENKNITIFTDSIFITKLFNIEGYPRFDYYHKKMDKILYKCNELNKNNINIKIVKIRSHINIMGNEKADRLAKYAAIEAKQMRDGIINNQERKYNRYFNPIMVDDQYFISKLDEMYKKNHRNEWKNIFKNEINNIYDETQYNEPERLFKRSMIDEQQNRVRKRSNHMRNELKYLKSYESEIINKLRTEYININPWNKQFFNDSNGNCQYCNCQESISHILFECNGFNNNDQKYLQARNKFFNKLKKIHIHFKNRVNLNALAILFPHIWLLNPRWNHPNYKQCIKVNLKIRVKILKQIVYYINEIDRFKERKYGI